MKKIVCQAATSIALLTFAVGSAGCIADIDDPDSEASDDNEQAIRNANSPGGPTPGMSWGAGRSEQVDCTFTFVNQQSALTTYSCAVGTKTVNVDGEVQTIRARHAFVSHSRQPSAVVAVSFKKAFKFGGAPVPRGWDFSPPTSGEQLHCYGYTGTKLLWETFVVGDYVAPFIPLSGLFRIGPGDLGGFCTRDGSFDPVAIITDETDASGYAEAQLIAGHQRGINGIEMISKSVSHGAVRLVDATQAFAMTAPVGSDEISMKFPSLGPDQAFYRVPMGNGQVQLVDAYAGDCVTFDGGKVVMRGCGNQHQTMFEHVVHVGGSDRYTYVSATSPGVIDFSTNPLTAASWAGTDEQRFRMWLAPQY